MKPEIFYDWEQVQSWGLEALLEKARRLSWEIHGREIKCFIPGRMFYMGERGQYPAISLTGKSCTLNCDHCRRKILEGMISAPEPEVLKEVCQRLNKEGSLGILLSGGSDGRGALPWNRFLEAIQWVKGHTSLKISIHTGLVDHETAGGFKDAGVDEVLIDVVGSEETMRRVYHFPGGLKAMVSSLDALAATKLPLIPHIVVGLHYGEIEGEMHALEMVAKHSISALVIVVLQPMRQTPMENVQPPTPETVARFIAAARLRIPHAPFSLSCARPLGPHRVENRHFSFRSGNKSYRHAL